MVKVSVAMTTYNGEEYLIDQLKSLLEQNREPDEVIICDDGSMDNTILIIQDFIEVNKLHSKWKLIVNKVNKGYTKNFLDCASITTGDIIFFCDQDDIWHSDKIGRMTEEFEKHRKIKAMSCTISVIDSQGNQQNTLFNKLRMGNGKLEKIDFSTQVRNNISVGLTLALRREVLNYLKPLILKNSLPFDVPVGLFTSIDGGYYILGKPLVYRRVHENNVSSPNYSLKSRLLNLDKHIEGRLKRIKLMKVCLHELQYKMNNEDKLNLKKTILSLENSVVNLRKRNVLPLILDVFSLNPMINRLVSVTNLLCALFGDYSKLETSRK